MSTTATSREPDGPGNPEVYSALRRAQAGMLGFTPQEVISPAEASRDRLETVTE